jgi:phosphoribosylformylglycinamidine synthase
LFGEDQARYLLAIPHNEAANILADAKKKGIQATLLGTAAGDRIAVENVGDVMLAALSRAHEGWFPRYMGGDALPPVN